MKYHVALIALCLALASADEYPIGTECSTMQPFCTENDEAFVAAEGVVIQDDTDNTDYGCLATYPNPSWYYMNIVVGGDMDIEIASTLGVDIDFAMWGPFASLDDAINDCGSYNSPHSCSYSGAAVETAELRGSNVGETWVLLITNYADVADNFITFSKVSGTAESDCGILTCDGEVSTGNAESNCGERDNGDTCFATCISGYELTSGSLERVCADGEWSEFDAYCSLIDPCSGVDCPMYSTCNDGECECWDEYVMEDDVCVEIDMCADYPCDVNAMCYNVDGSTDFTCECNEGYEGDGFFCELPEVEEECEEEEEECCETVRKSTNVINVQFADIFAGYDGYIKSDDDCCSCGCGCGCGCC